MVTISMKYFDTHEFVEKSKELATKLDIKELELKIAQASNRILLLMGTFCVFFLGVLAKGFHWF